MNSEYYYIGSQRRNVKSESIDHPVVCLADLFWHYSQQFQFAYHFRMGKKYTTGQSITAIKPTMEK